MGVRIVREFKPEERDVRATFCDTLIELAEENENIVILDADLMSAMGTKPFAQKFPERAIDCGIQEANMVGVAAGLSATGKIPFAHTFGPFMTRRACDQIYVSAAYAQLNVKLIGSDPGVTAAINGGTHMPFEDMSIMRSVPGMTCIEPTDATMLKSVLRQVAGVYGMHYMRIVRKSAIKVYEDDSEFEVGKAARLKEGGDVTIIASGYCVSEALRAAASLETEGISAAVLDMFTWKPVDVAAVVEAAGATGAIVTAENHTVMGGLGSAVAEVLVKNKPVPMEMVGVQDLFGQVGPAEFLAEHYGITEKYIAEAARKVIGRK